MRAGYYADKPVVGHFRPVFFRQGIMPFCRGIFIKPYNVSGSQSATLMSAEFSQSKCRPASKNLRNVDTSGYGKISSHTFFSLFKAENVSGLRRNRLIHRHGLAVKRAAHISSGYTEGDVRPEPIASSS